MIKHTITKNKLNNSNLTGIKIHKSNNDIQFNNCDSINKENILIIYFIIYY